MNYKLVRTVDTVQRECPKFDKYIFWFKRSHDRRLTANVKSHGTRRADDLYWSALLRVEVRPPRLAP